MQIPDFDLKTVGHNASVDMHDDFKAPLFIKDIQHLLLYALMGTKAPVEPSRFELNTVFVLTCTYETVKNRITDTFGIKIVQLSNGLLTK